SLVLPTMRVPVKGRRHAESIQRLFEAAASQKRMDLARLALDGFLDRGIVKERESSLDPHLRERGLELERFLDRVPHELLHNLLAPGLEHASTEPRRESLHACEAESPELHRIAVQDPDRRAPERGLDFLLLIGMKVVISQNGEDRNRNSGKFLC